MGLGTAVVGIRETAASSVRRYFDIAAGRLGLHAEMRWLLSAPFRELTVQLPLRRDDEKLQLFRGYRVQHNSVRGPVLGPMRIDSAVTLDTLRATAESMTWRCAVANVPFGGASGGIACDPTQLSPRELERVVRKYVSRLHHVLGRYQDVSIPDRDLGVDTMSWIDEEYAALHRESPPSAIGKLAANGGLPQREAIIGRAVGVLALRVAEDHGRPISGLRAAIQTMDQTGIHAAAALEEAGCVVVGIHEIPATQRSASDVDAERSQHAARQAGTTLHSRAGKDFHALDCDLLVISGPECALGPAAAQQVRAKIVIETSELVISPAADSVLAGRGVLVVPDMVGASAPLLAASAEWSSQVQKPPAPEALQREVEMGMLRAYEQVLDRSRREGLSLRTAAYCSAIEKVARSERLRVA